MGNTISSDEQEHDFKKEYSYKKSSRVEKVKSVERNLKEIDEKCNEVIKEVKKIFIEAKKKKGERKEFLEKMVFKENELTEYMIKLDNLDLDEKLRKERKKILVKVQNVLKIMDELKQRNEGNEGNEEK